MHSSVLYKKLLALPENLKSEVADFIDFLIQKSKKNQGTGKPVFGSGKGMFKTKQESLLKMISLKNME